jgi:hypothetical protein
MLRQHSVPDFLATSPIQPPAVVPSSLRDALDDLDLGAAMMDERIVQPHRSPCHTQTALSLRPVHIYLSMLASLSLSLSLQLPLCRFIALRLSHTLTHVLTLAWLCGACRW